MPGNNKPTLVKEKLLKLICSYQYKSQKMHLICKHCALKIVPLQFDFVS